MVPVSFWETGVIYRMECFTIEKPDRNVVSCLKEIPENPQAIVIAVHGFSSSRECATYQLLLRRMPAAGYGVIGIDLPGHGSAESLRETLRIESCINSIEAAEKFAAAHFPELPIFYFASSFGAYITGLYISTRPHLGRKAFFRSAAVNMPALFTRENPIIANRTQLADLEEKGYFDASVETAKPVQVTREMIRDLEETDLFRLFDAGRFGSTSVMMVHGADDAVIDPDAARSFAERFHIPIHFYPDEGHSLSDHPETPDRLADLAIAFYAGDQEPAEDTPHNR